MKLTVSATVKDQNKKVMKGAKIGLFYFSTTAAAKLLKQGLTNAQGKILLVANLNTTVSPRLQLRYLPAGQKSWRTIADDPISFDKAGKVNFGSIEIQASKTAVVAGKSLFGLRSGSTPIVAAATASKTTKASDMVAKKDFTLLQSKHKTLESSNKTLTSSNKSLLAEKLKIINEKKKLENDLKLKAQQINTLQPKINQLNAVTKEKQALSSQLLQIKKQLEQAKKDAASKNQQLAQQNDKKGATDINNFAASIGQQLESAQKQLRQQKSSYRLGNISMQIKGIPSAGGTIKLPEADEIQNSAPGLSTFNLDFQAQDASEDPGEALFVPDLIGYSPTMASNKTQALGLQLETRKQNVTIEAEHGRILSQSPAAGEEIEAGEIVVAIVGKLMRSQ